MLGIKLKFGLWGSFDILNKSIFEMFFFNFYEFFSIFGGRGRRR